MTLDERLASIRAKLAASQGMAGYDARVKTLQAEIAKAGAAK